MVLSKVPSKTLQSNFISSIFNESDSLTQSSADRGLASDGDAFKPLVVRSYNTLDDLEVASLGQSAKSSIGWSTTPKPSKKGRLHGRTFALHLTPLSLGQLRLTLFVIDCYLIATRFYTTYAILREILVGRKLVVDAASYLSILASLPMQKHVNRGAKQNTAKPTRYSVFEEETHYQCGHSPAAKTQVDGSLCEYQQYEQACQATFIRPVKSVQEIGGSSISTLHMTIARNNRYIVILFGCALVLFLVVFAVSVNHRLLHKSRSDRPAADNGAVGDSDFYAHSEGLVKTHVENLNRVLLSLTRLNEHRLRTRMQRFADRFRHDLRHVEHQFLRETCQIERLLTSSRWSGEASAPTKAAQSLSSCSPPSPRPIEVGSLFRQELCQFLPLKPSSHPRFLQHPIKHQRWQITSASPITYLWRALASWIGGLSPASPLVVSHFLVIALCIAVVMFGLIGIFQSVGKLCHRLQQGEPALDERSVRLLSSVPPPLERKLKPPPTRVFSVVDEELAPSLTPLSLPIDGVKIVETATLVGDSAIGNAQQYVLFSNSLQQPEATFFLSNEHSHGFCRSVSAPSEV